MLDGIYGFQVQREVNSHSNFFEPLPGGEEVAESFRGIHLGQSYHERTNTRTRMVNGYGTVVWSSDELHGLPFEGDEQ